MRKKEIAVISVLIFIILGLVIYSRIAKLERGSEREPEEEPNLSANLSD